MCVCVCVCVYVCICVTYTHNDLPLDAEVIVVKQPNLNLGLVLQKPENQVLLTTKARRFGERLGTRRGCKGQGEQRIWGWY